MRSPLLSPEASTLLINRYCNERHDGKLKCVVHPVKGRTLRATRAFAVGEIILEEPPLHAVRLNPDNPMCSKLTRICETRSFMHPAIWYWCAVNSVLVEGDPPVDGLQTITRRQWDLLRILFVPETVKASSEAVCLVDNMGLRGIVKDIDMEIMIQVWLHNCFEHHRSPEGYAIYFLPSFCSHSCLPNTLWCTDNNSNFRFFPRATVSAGDEITLTYLSEDDMLRNTSYRRELLEGAKDFKCMCERCVSSVDFSRGFRCPNCRQGVIYVHADVTGSSQAFDGALLTEQIEGEGTVRAPISAADSTSDSPVSDERGPDRWRNSETPCTLIMHTIWAQLLTGGSRCRQGAPSCGGAGEGVTACSETERLPANHETSLDIMALSATSNVDTAALLREFSKMSALISPQATSRVLQVPQSGCCCSCQVKWTESQQQRALAVEMILEAVIKGSEEVEEEPVGPSLASSHAGAARRSQGPYAEANEDADARAHQVLQRIGVPTLLQLLNRRWHSLDRQERQVVDSIIRLTFKTHWYGNTGFCGLLKPAIQFAWPMQGSFMKKSWILQRAALSFTMAHKELRTPLFRIAALWFRFQESASSSSRKLAYLDGLIWQYRNLYPGLTPTLAWAVWDVAQALLSVGEGSKLRKSANFRCYADHCIVSSYNEAVFILSALFGADGSFHEPIVSNYSATFKECLERVKRQCAPSMSSVHAAECLNSEAVELSEVFQLPHVWPWYISSCAEVAVVTPNGSTLIRGSALIDVYCNRRQLEKYEQ